MKALFFGLFAALTPYIISAQETRKMINAVAIDSIMADYSKDSPGAALMIVQKGKILFQKTYGLANLEDRVSISPATNFRLASVSKQFTAAAIMILKERKLLDLNQSLTYFFPAFPAYGAAIRIHHLLNHSSGIHDYEDFVADTAFNPQISDAGVLEILTNQGKPYFRPGDQFRYSNSGYALLALIVEKVSGLRYADFLDKHIFGPLKMANTLAYEKSVSEVKHRAFGYSRGRNGWQRRDQSSTSAVLGDGGIYSNLEDFYRWDQSLYSQSILSKESWELVFNWSSLNSGRQYDYGFGWHLKRDARGEKIVFHTGSSTSFRNIYYRVPAEEISLLFLTNRNEPAEFSMIELAEKILAQTENTQ